MKTVYDKRMVAHIWAAGSQDNARTPRDNFSFTGPKLYSYAQPIAYILPDDYRTPEGARIVLINSSTYSVTTSRHQYLARCAANHFTQISVPGLSENMLCDINRRGLGEIVDAILGDVRDDADKAATSRRVRDETRRGHIASARARQKDARLLLGLDAMRKLGKVQNARIKAQRKIADLSPDDCGGYADFAWRLNKNRYLKDYARWCASVRAILGELPTASANDAARRADQMDSQMCRLRDVATSARKTVPRDIIRAYKKVAPDSAWRLELAERMRQENIARAMEQWAGLLPDMLTATAALDAFLTSDFTKDWYLKQPRNLVETLKGEPDHDSRAAILEKLETMYRDYRIGLSSVFNAEELVNIGNLFSAGNYRAARDNAASVANRQYISEAHRAKAIEWRDRAAAMTAEQDARDLNAWRACELARLPHYLQSVGDDRRALLRVSADKSRIETSQGAEVPMEVCARLWPAINAVRDMKEGRDFRGDVFRLGHFKLDRIDADGTIHAGCHTIGFDELAGIARQIGLAE